MGLEPRSSNFSNSRKDDWDWEGGGAGREAERDRVNGRMAESVGI